MLRAHGVEDLPWVHQPMRIKTSLQRLHHADGLEAKFVD